MNSPVRNTVVWMPRPARASRICAAPRSDDPPSKDTRTSRRSAGPRVRSGGNSPPAAPFAGGSDSRVEAEAETGAEGRAEGGAEGGAVDSRGAGAAGETRTAGADVSEEENPIESRVGAGAGGADAGCGRAAATRM